MTTLPLEAVVSEARQEDEYFARLELEKKRKLHGQQRSKQAASSLAERKTLHFNKCGKCGDTMETVAFRGIEIEICPDCGAVLLDSGELEQLAGADKGGTLSSFFESFFGKF